MSPGPRELVILQERVQVLLPVIGIRIIRVGELHVVGNRGQTRDVRRQILKRDGAVTVRRHLHARGQQIASGLVQLDLTLNHCIGQQDSGQDLGRRTEFKNRIAIRNSPIVATHPAISEDFLLSLAQHADRHADDHVVVEIGLYEPVGL